MPSDTPPSLARLVGSIRSGRIPAPIFNATAMEVGRRVMITPIRFEEPISGGRAGPRRAPTLSEYLLGERSTSYADLPLWTAARLSATFPYVTPAARWEGVATRVPHHDERPDATPDYRAAHHMIDGGYYDNYGVASALDWLRIVFEHRVACVDCAHLPRLRRVAVVQLRAFSPAPPNAVRPSSSFIATLAGPAVGIASIRDGTATSRNEIELGDFVDSWNQRLAGELSIRAFTIEPARREDPGPLSWRLTPSQVGAMKTRWRDEAVQREVQELMEFLGP